MFQRLIFRSRSRILSSMPFHGTTRQVTVQHASAPIVNRCRESYEKAVNRLNTLQSNAAYLAKTAAEKDQRRHQQIPLTVQTANRVGIDLQDLDKLSIIHVTGTKGKGSTCALTESILRAHGYKTGFFSSPHLVEVRERIRIGGWPLSQDAFQSYFWDCYSKLDQSKQDYDGYMPPYFQFLTVMALHVFLVEKVDVAVLEVGIGGEYDSTNIVPKPVVCGITSLGIDHVSLLGDTIAKIAWHKAGIMKPGVPLLTVSQPDDSMEVLHNRALEKQSSLYVTPASIHEYDSNGHQITIGIPGEKQEINASLAVQLCNVWIQNRWNSSKISTELDEESDRNSVESQAVDISTFPLSDIYIKGIENCYWPGRCQKIVRPGITFYVDGAHTPRSIESASKWFTETSNREADHLRGKVMKILIFNATGDRKSEALLDPLLNCGFSLAVFCPNIATTVAENSADQTNLTVTKSTMLSKSQEHQKAWISLQKAMDKKIASEHNTHQLLSDSNQEKSQWLSHNMHDMPEMLSQEKENFYQKERSVRPSNRDTAYFGCILEALHWASQGRELGLPKIPLSVQKDSSIAEADYVQVFCTGSLHLVGGILGFIEPTVCDKKSY